MMTMTRMSHPTEMKEKFNLATNDHVVSCGLMTKRLLRVLVMEKTHSVC
jgi:hypothetical protein